MKSLKTLSLAVSLPLLMAAGSAAAADIAAGKPGEKGNCATCHGADLKSPISPEYPKLAGQHASYLLHALLAYQTSNSPLVGRSNAIMAGRSTRIRR